MKATKTDMETTYNRHRNDIKPTELGWYSVAKELA